jgi:RNA polymerase sigma-70 factor, ECF subfamily
MSDAKMLARGRISIRPADPGLSRRRLRYCAPPARVHEDGDKAAIFPISFRAAQTLVFRVALRITRNEHDAEDAQQEALIKAYRKLSQFQGRSRFTTWLSSIAINEALMCRRRGRSSVSVPFADYAAQIENAPRSSLNPALENAEEAYLRKELGETLSSSLLKLSPCNRSVFVLRALQGLSTAETAEALRVSVSAVKTRMRRARLQLQNLLRHSRRVHPAHLGTDQLTRVSTWAP